MGSNQTKRRKETIVIQENSKETLRTKEKEKNLKTAERRVKESKIKDKNKLKQFVLDTLLPYKEDRANCATKNGLCCYLSEDGKKCAVGRHLKDGKWQNYEGSALDLFDTYSTKILNEEALSMNIPPRTWENIQQYHDEMEGGTATKLLVDYAVDCIENALDIKLPELRL